MKKAAADIVIFGGGIAGLWALNRLRQQGLSVILFESGYLGGGQTHKSQGIIHGGMKYALQGSSTKDAQAMAGMPTLWKQCLQGQGEIDLSHVPILSSQQYLWSPYQLTAKLTGFFANLALQSKVSALSRENYPMIFQHSAFKGEVFALDEIVVDVPILLRELVKANQDAIFKIEPLCDQELKFNNTGNLESATVYMAGKSIEINAQHFIFTAGAGNEIIINRLKTSEIKMQRRPLHMVLVKMPFEYTLYAHCLGLGPRPRVTITTHHDGEGRLFWYLGGQLAEDGIRKSSEAQIQETKNELKSLFPWLDFAHAEWATLMIDRAEPLQKNGLKPETTFVKTIHNMTIAWPTKLALAPRLSQEILQQIQSSKITAKIFDTREMRSWPIPPLARPIWEEMFCKNVA